MSDSSGCPVDADLGITGSAGILPASGWGLARSERDWVVPSNGSPDSVLIILESQNGSSRGHNEEDGIFQLVKSIEQVRSELAAGGYDLTRHAFRRMAERNISDHDIREAGSQAEVVEEYPDDKYSPSCLLLGYTRATRPIHIQVSLRDTPFVKIVTLYEPDPNEWVDDVRRT